MFSISRYSIHERFAKGNMKRTTNGISGDISMEELLFATMEKLTINPKIFIKYVDNLFCIVKKTENGNALYVLNS